MFIVRMLLCVDYFSQQSALNKEGQRPIDCRPRNRIPVLAHAHQKVLRSKMIIVSEGLFKNGAPLRGEPQSIALKVFAKPFNNLWLNRLIAFLHGKDLPTHWLMRMSTLCLWFHFWLILRKRATETEFFQKTRFLSHFALSFYMSLIFLVPIVGIVIPH